MSNWTHVAAIARIDATFLFDAPLDFTKVFGKELHFDDSVAIWDLADEHPELFLPLGSEGSLSMSVWKNPNIHEVDAYTVSIFGDLRDHDNPEEIVQWFKDKLAPLWIRGASIIVENEQNGTVTWCKGMMN